MSVFAGDEIQKRLLSYRTQYIRHIKAPASGSGKRKKTRRQEWFIRVLYFLQPYISKRWSLSNILDDVGVLFSVQGVISQPT